MNSHLTHQQLCDLLIDSTPEAASAAHLAACLACSSEFATLNASLSNFRQASIQFAKNTINQSPAQRPLLLPAKRTRSFLAVPAYIAAAAALAVAILVPMHSNGPVPVAHVTGGTPVVTASTESDEALFDQINQDIAASVPGPMEPLANPASLESTR